MSFVSPGFVGFVAVGCVALGVVSWIGSERALHPAYPRYEWSLATYPDLHPEPAPMRAADDILLQGQFFSGKRTSLIILASGYGDTQDQMLPFAEFLHRSGFSVLTYNSRARAPSGGEFVTLGALETGDLLSVVDSAAARHDVDPNKIAVLGISMGGSVAILSAARDQRIRAVVDDSGFSDAPSIIDAGFEHFIHLPAFPFAPLTVALADFRAGIDVNAVRPMDVIGRISPRPVLIVHEAGDPVVPADNSERNFAAARQPKDLWLVPGNRHGRAHTDARSEYEKRVTAFFDSALR
jgi:fermentation-respiration switch protein FrsA (DUF1100 family)